MEKSEDDKMIIEIFLYDKPYNFKIDGDKEEVIRKGASLYNDRLQIYLSRLGKNIEEGDLTKTDILVLLGHEFATMYADLLLSADSTDKILDELLGKIEK